MKVLWLDDIRDPVPHGYIGAHWVLTADDCIEALKTKLYHFASLDHDLSDKASMGMPEKNERTGYTVICWLEENPEYWPEIGVRVHSVNPVGKGKMQQVIMRHYGRNF